MWLGTHPRAEKSLRILTTMAKGGCHDVITSLASDKSSCLHSVMQQTHTLMKTTLDDSKKNSTTANPRESFRTYQCWQRTRAMPTNKRWTASQCLSNAEKPLACPNEILTTTGALIPQLLAVLAYLAKGPLAILYSPYVSTWQRKYQSQTLPVQARDIHHQ